MLLQRCPQCGQYTMRDACPRCGAPTCSAHPARFSPEDRFSEERILFYQRNPGLNRMTQPQTPY